MDEKTEKPKKSKKPNKVGRPRKPKKLGRPPAPKKRGRPPKPKKKGRPFAPKKRGRPPKPKTVEKVEKPVEVKVCPKCGEDHTRNSAFCSLRCAHLGKKVSQETIETHRKNTRDYYNSPEGMAFRERQRNRAIKLNKGENYTELRQEDIMVEIPNIVDIDDIRDFLHGDFNFGSNW